MQRTPAWVMPRCEVMPRFAVPAAQHISRLTVWLQRVAVYWRSELMVGLPMVTNNHMIMSKVCEYC